MLLDAAVLEEMYQNKPQERTGIEGIIAIYRLMSYWGWAVIGLAMAHVFGRLVNMTR